MHENMQTHTYPVPRTWSHFLAYLALPLLLVVFGGIWPILNPPTQGSGSHLDPLARRAAIEQWEEIYVPRPFVQPAELVNRAPTPTALFVADH